MIATALALSFLSLSQPGPSFDCRRATTDSERAICADPLLSTLDRDMAAQYGRTRARLSGPGRDALRRDQQAFLRLREIVYDGRDDPVMADFPRLGERIAQRTSFLSDINARPQGELIGVWGNLFGTVEIRRGTDGRFIVAIDTVNPQTAGWICHVEYEGAVVDGRLDGPPIRDREVTVGVRLRDGYIEVTETWVVEAHDSADYCGHNGFVAGDYLPIQPR